MLRNPWLPGCAPDTVEKLTALTKPYSSYGPRAEVSDALNFHPWTGPLAKKNNLRHVKLIRYFARGRHFANKALALLYCLLTISSNIGIHLWKHHYTSANIIAFARTTQAFARRLQVCILVDEIRDIAFLNMEQNQATYYSRLGNGTHCMQRNMSQYASNTGLYKCHSRIQGYMKSEEDRFQRLSGSKVGYTSPECKEPFSAIMPMTRLSLTHVQVKIGEY